VQQPALVAPPLGTIKRLSVFVAWLSAGTWQNQRETPRTTLPCKTFTSRAGWIPKQSSARLSSDITNHQGPFPLIQICQAHTARPSHQKNRRLNRPFSRFQCCLPTKGGVKPWRKESNTNNLIYHRQFVPIATFQCGMKRATSISNMATFAMSCLSAAVA